MDDAAKNFGRVMTILNENIAQLQGQVQALAVAKAEVSDQADALAKVLRALLNHEDVTPSMRDHAKELLDANGCFSAEDAPNG
jgi:hypothetical protein